MDLDAIVADVALVSWLPSSRQSLQAQHGTRLTSGLSDVPLQRLQRLTAGDLRHVAVYVVPASWLSLHLIVSTGLSRDQAHEHFI